MTSADMIKFYALTDIIEDAELLAVLIKEDRTVGLRDEALRMKRNFSCVAFPGNIAPAAAKYSETVRLACDGLHIDPNVVPEIREFQRMLEGYRATC